MNAKPYVLEQTNWKQVKSQKYEVAILPWGATEPHNYHLPYGTDSLETAKIAEQSAGKAWEKGAKVMVLPVIPLGAQNMGQIDMPFCLHTKPSTQLIILKDILTAFSGQGIKKLVIMNGHGGNDLSRWCANCNLSFLICLYRWWSGFGCSIRRIISKKPATMPTKWKQV